MLWGLYRANDVPGIPDAVLMKDFYFRFSNSQEVQKVVDNAASPDLIPKETILSLKEVRAGGGKVARSLGHIELSEILYCQGIFAKTGIRVWCPDLQDAPDSLYNSACRITALKTFRELLTCGTYNYMNVKPQYIDAFPLFIRVYNHFVHNVMTSKFKAEIACAGRAAVQNSRKVI